jgi:hypothetical protein
MYIFWAVVLLGAEAAVCIADLAAAAHEHEQTQVYLESDHSKGLS